MVSVAYPDGEHTPFGWCDYCGDANGLGGEDWDRTVCPRGHSFEQMYNWGGYNDEHGRLDYERSYDPDSGRSTLVRRAQ